jgi:hypothetical protein
MIQVSHILSGTFLVFLLVSCQTTDPEYKQAVAHVSSAEVSPQKIVGEWVVIYNYSWGEYKTSYKFLPNGTGLKRDISKFRSGGGAVIEQDLAWQYSGANKWTVTQGPPRVTSGSCSFGMRIREPFTLRSYKDTMLHSAGRVFVNMDNDERVKAKLQQIRTQAAMSAF